MNYQNKKGGFTMINQVVIVGVLSDFNLDRKKLYLRVKRDFKNQNGEYVDDCVVVNLTENEYFLTENIELLLGKGYAVKCRIVSPNFYDPMQLVVERISLIQFLKST
jgi:hypothetical protein